MGSFEDVIGPQNYLVSHALCRAADRKLSALFAHDAYRRAKLTGRAYSRALSRDRDMLLASCHENDAAM
jgi:hypothetical protein